MTSYDAGPKILPLKKIGTYRNVCGKIDSYAQLYIQFFIVSIESESVEGEEGTLVLLMDPGQYRLLEDTVKTETQVPIPTYIFNNLTAGTVVQTSKNACTYKIVKLTKKVEGGGGEWTSVNIININISTLFIS